MKKIVSGKQMQEFDRYTIESMGVPSLVLMERAALAVTEEMVASLQPREKILVVCGMGNNGGDGIAIARMIHLKGYQVAIALIGNQEKLSPSAKIQKNIAINYGVDFVNNPVFHEYTTIVDALFGVGLSRKIEGIYGEAVEKINSSSAKIWAVDIPSGICADTGRVLGHGVRADVTVTFAYGKIGHYLFPGASYCGRLVVRDVGIYSPGNPGLIQAVESRDLTGKSLPKRQPEGNKGTFGKVLVVAGSKNMAGAAYLCGGAVLKSGAGMVKIHTVEENRVILQQLLPEALLYTDTEEDSLQPGKAQLEKKWEKNLDWADVVVMGPGIGTNLPVVTWYLEHFKKPMVLDADALNLMAEHPKLLENIGPHCILTPHPGELGRLMKLPVGKLKEDYLHFVKKFADEYKVTCVGKDARTVTVTCRGQIWLNLSGNDGMATAGSGDVLSGILGGLLAQGMPVCEAAPFGVYLHGLAGDAQAKRKGRRSLLASDLLKGLEKILKKCEEKE